MNGARLLAMETGRRGDADEEPMAVRLAAMLRRRKGDGAWAAARARSATAFESGDLPSADLYHAVAVILKDRDRVFSSMPRMGVE